MGKCPHCNSLVSTLTLGDVRAGKWNGVSYSCPSCSAVLSVAIDPIALKADTISGVAERLKIVQEQLAAIQN